MGGCRTLFGDFAAVAESIGVYTARDYADIMEHLIAKWAVESLKGLSAEGLAAQQYVCDLPERFRKLAERAAGRKTKAPPVTLRFSWVFNRPLEV